MGIFLSGNSQAGNWTQKPGPSSFYVLKSHVEIVLVKLGIDPWNLETAGLDNRDFSDGQVYLLNDKPLLEFGAVSSRLLQQFDIDQPVYAAEFNWDGILKALSDHRILFTPLPRFQVVLRDFSMVLDKSVTFESLRVLAFNTERKLLKNVSLFDVYDGEKIEKGKKSYALSFTLLDENKTLTDKQIDKIMLNLARAFEREFAAKIRGLS
jgi:phenylalanyl-tRNA synthetase beta chain